MQYGEYKRSSGGNVEGNMADVFVGRKRERFFPNNYTRHILILPGGVTEK